MSNQYSSEQEEKWAGDYGQQYTQRNLDPKIITYRKAFFTKIISRTPRVRSILEFGAGIGFNLQALRELSPDLELRGLEINRSAANQMSAVSGVIAITESILNYRPKEHKMADFVLTYGLLIHIAPNLLKEAYTTLFEASSRYICIVEYYNPTPVDVVHRGHTGMLFKRDFAGEMLDIFPNLSLLDYGFQYHRDTYFPADDVNWFLLEKN